MANIPITFMLLPLEFVFEALLFSSFPEDDEKWLHFDRWELNDCDELLLTKAFEFIKHLMDMVEQKHY